MILRYAFLCCNLGFAACAPLTQPEVAADPMGSGPESAGQADQPLSTLERYLRDRTLMADSAAVRPHLGGYPL